MRSFAREAWADVQDSSQEQITFGDGPSQSPQSQSSVNPSQLFPATPDSFEGGGSQSQQALRQRFAGCALNSPIESIDEDSQVLGDYMPEHHDGNSGNHVVDLTAPRTPEPVAQISNFNLGGMTSCETPGLKQELPNATSGGWSIHTLQTHASAMAASAASPVRNRVNRQKRGNHPASQTPLGKRRATLATISGSPTERHAARATPMENIPMRSFSSASDASTQVPPQSLDVEDVTEENQENPPERRLQKRCNAVNSIKSKDEYRLVHWLRGQGVLQQMVEAGLIPEAPKTPNPENVEDTSKRSWEKGVQTWREELRNTTQAYERFYRH